MTDDAARAQGQWNMVADHLVLTQLSDTATYSIYRSAWPDDTTSNLDIVVDGQRLARQSLRLPLDKDASVVVTGKRIELRAGVGVAAAGTFERLWPDPGKIRWMPWRMRGTPRKDSEAVPLVFLDRPRWLRVHVESITPEVNQVATKFIVDGKVVAAQDGQEAMFGAGTAIDLHAREVIVDFWPLAGVDTACDVRGWLGVAMK